MTSNPKTFVLVTSDRWIYKTKEPLESKRRESPTQRNPNQPLRLIRQLNLQSLLSPALRHLPPSLPQNIHHLLLIRKLRLKLIKLIIQKHKTSNILQRLRIRISLLKIRLTHQRANPRCVLNRIPALNANLLD
ncbi:hypothetical protein VN97_g3593 [Penicillium thymicola]|uniref:Uncharacterized protein n=1 Tax=Penicillium thymicola TaxID=293382 RepID=A0AAI9XAN7_PENTH|nr:hypothetical protein VN97_g3593 [Penicillium thymicola]